MRGWGWRHAGRRAWAVRGLDLAVPPGERVLLLGPSGAGKSTLLAAAAGLLEGDAEGSLTVDGLPAAAARGRVGLLRQDPASSLVMGRAGDDVAFGPENTGVRDVWPRVDEALDLVAFRYGRDRDTAALSGGEQQRLALAGVLALRPRLLLLDEPTAALDPSGRALVLAALRDALDATGATLLLVEHRVDEVRDLVGRVVVLAPGGGVVADGTPAAVLGPARRHLAPATVPAPAGVRPAVAAGRGTAARGPAAAPAAEVLRLAGVHHPRLGPAAAAAARDLVLHAGEALVVTGPNGAGKSTLALLAAGLLEPAAGAASAPGRDEPLHRWRAADLAAYVGTVFQDPEHQFLAGTVRAEVALGPRRAGVDPAAADARADELLRRLRLDHLAQANPFTLSGGEQRRLSLATALATRPRLLVLDEPSSGQDPQTWRELVALLRGLRDEGTALLVVTHDEELADALADRRLDLADRPPSTPTVGPVPGEGDGRPDQPRAVLARRHPLAKVGAATLLGLTLVASLDPVTPALVLLATLAVLPLTGVRLRALLRRARPLLLAAAGVGLVNALTGTTEGGRVLLDAGPLEVTTAAALTGLAVALRVLAIALPGVLVVLTTEPVELADGLVQTARVPARPAYAAVAALRLVPLLRDEWATLARARRARGVDSGGRPVPAARLFAGQVLGLLVAAVRRGTRLAAGMDARGFDSGAERTSGRPVHWRAADTALIAAAAVVAAGAVAASVLLGTWRPLVGG